MVLVRVLWDGISKICSQFWHSFFKNTLESSYNFCPIEIMWRKMLHSVWHQCQWQRECLHTLWRFTVPVYIYISITVQNFNFIYLFPLEHHIHNCSKFATLNQFSRLFYLLDQFKHFYKQLALMMANCQNILTNCATYDLKYSTAILACGKW